MSVATETTSPQLPRVLGPWMAAAVVVGAVIGSGVFKKASAIAVDVPNAGPALLTWAVVGIVTLFGALALAEVATRFDRTGGNYVYLRATFGERAAFLWGWVEFWFIRCASNAAVVTVFVEAFHGLLQWTQGNTEPILSYWSMQLLGAAILTALGILNGLGTVLGASVQFVLTAIKILTLLAIMAIPVVVLATGISTPTAPQLQNFQPLWPSEGVNWSGFATAMIAVLWAYNGWTNIAPIAGEVRDPGRNVPRAIIGGVLVLIFIYTGVNAAYYTVIPSAELAAIQDRPVAIVFAEKLFGTVGILLASGTMLLSTFGSLGGTILVSSRGIFAMSHDGLAPAAIGRVHPRFQTPFVATMVVTVCSVAMVLCGALYAKVFESGRPPFDIVTDFSIFGATLFETLAVAAI
ncbi:MAG: APC family permease, partial [Gemmataceae bacterium]